MRFTFGKLLSLTIGVLGTAYFGNKVYESVKDITAKEEVAAPEATETTEEKSEEVTE